MVGNNNKIKSGFSLVETLIAIAIVSLSLIGPLSIASNGLKTSAISKDRLIATTLAQDGIEFIRYVRDTNIASNPNGWPDNWLDGVSGPCRRLNDNIPGCITDSLNSLEGGNKVDNIDKPVGKNDRYLNYDPVTGIYTYSSGSGYIESKFKRITEVAVTKSVTRPTGEVIPAEALVKTTVSWEDPVFGNQSIFLQTYIFNL